VLLFKELFLHHKTNSNNAFHIKFYLKLQSIINYDHATVAKKKKKKKQYGGQKQTLAFVFPMILRDKINMFKEGGVLSAPSSFLILSGCNMRTRGFCKLNILQNIGKTKPQMNSEVKRATANK